MSFGLIQQSLRLTKILSTNPEKMRTLERNNSLKILDHVISTLDLNASLKDIRQGVFHTGVLSRHCGLAATLPKDALF
jgi:hypothetical protein